MNGVLGAFALQYFFGLAMAPFLVFHLSLWAACDLAQVGKVGSSLKVPLALAWFLREVIAVPMWIYVASGNSVQWRGRVLQLRRGGLLGEA